MDDDGSSSSSPVFSISNPHQQQQQSLFHHHQNLFQQQHSSPIPVTHQLFQHPHQFHPFQQQSEPSVHHNHVHQQQQQQQQQQRFLAVDFKLGLNENSVKKEAALALNHHQHNDATFLHGNQQHSLLNMPHCWHPQEDSPIKEPFWKPLNRREDRQCSGEVAREIVEGNKYNKVLQQPPGQCTTQRSKNLDNNKYRHFGELEAIYGLAKGGVGGETAQAGSGSALTVKQVTDHQEGLHKKFLEVIERMDKERTLKEESWRRQEDEKRNRESIARAHEQALATSREAVIVSYLEKITGQSINLPARAIEPFNECYRPVKVDNNGRWPRAEVEALIQARCNLEAKFKEPGTKGAVWEDVSSSMASLGFQRSAKRCKEKWENINKYFRKSKENGKKRSLQSKTCTYFDQLDQLYSRIPIACPTSFSPLMNSDFEMQQQSDSDFLEAYVPERDIGTTAQVKASGGSLKVSEIMKSSKLDFDGAVGDNEEVHEESKGKDNKSHDNSYLEKEGEREEDDNDTDMGE
ncbi:hypothetical protein COLO4_21134 [Corchorus olitorius]|uniref:Myb-like domain-containing protein n=1 Tax=Corchorus olitorius TaxID=93759 RepID=A0A1R3IVC4_9ROSI|nr:hypothetical protein COLO4_21134 [Corchorus olitorius]